MKKWLLVALASLFPALIPAYPLAHPAVAAQVVDRIVAVVNGQIITQYDLTKRLRPIEADIRAKNGPAALDDDRLRILQRGMLDRMINDILVLDEAKRLGVQVTDSDIEGHIRQVKKNNNISDEDFAQQLKADGFTRKEYEQTVREDMQRYRLVQVMVGRKVLVTDDEVQSFYERTTGRGVSTGKAVDLAVILVPSDFDAAGLAGKIRNKQMPFEDAARQYSEGPAKEEGGRLGPMRWSELSPEWRQAVEGLKDGDVSQPISIGGRKAILKVLKHTTAADDPALDAQRDQIRQALFQPKFEKQYDEFLKRLREKAIVDVRL